MPAEPDVEGFAALGVTVTPDSAADDEPEGYPVWSINWPSLLAFLDLATQWQIAIAPNGRLAWIGLDYVAADVVLRRRRLGDDVFDDIRAMEAAALPILNSGAA